MPNLNFEELAKESAALDFEEMARESAQETQPEALDFEAMAAESTINTGPISSPQGTTPTPDRASPSALAGTTKTEAEEMSTGVFGGRVNYDEIEAVAKKYDTSPAALKALLSFTTDTMTQEGQQYFHPQGVVDAVGRVASIVPAVGAATKFATGLVSPGTESALDELRALSNARRDGLQTATNIGTNMVGGMKGVLKAADWTQDLLRNSNSLAGAATGAAAMVGLGAAEGGMGADRGNKLAGTAAGGVMGLVPGGRALADHGSAVARVAGAGAAMLGGGLTAKEVLDAWKGEAETNAGALARYAAGALAGAVIAGSGKARSEAARDARQAVVPDVVMQRAAQYVEKPPQDLQDIYKRIDIPERSAAKEKPVPMATEPTVNKFLQFALGKELDPELPLGVHRKLSGEMMDELRGRGQQYIENARKKFVEAEAVSKAQRELGNIVIVPQSGTRSAQFIGDVGRTFDEIDRAHTTGFARHLQKVSQDERWANNTMVNIVDKHLAPAEKMLRASPYSKEQMYDFLRKVESKGWDGIPPDAKPIMEGIHKGLRTAKDEIRAKTGMDIRDLSPNYFPMYALPNKELTVAVRAKGREALAKLGLPSFDKAYSLTDIYTTGALTPQDVAGFKLLSGLDIETPHQLQAAMSQLAEGGIDEARTQLVAQALRSRKGGMPDWALDKNPLRVLDRYLHGNLRAAALQDTVLNVRADREVLIRRAKDGNPKDAQAVQFIDDWLDSLTGGKPKYLAGRISGASEQLSIGLADAAKKMQEKGNTGGAYVAEQMSKFPEMFGYIRGLIYPNVLSTMKALDTNISTLGTMIAPQYGSDWYTKNALKAIDLNAKVLGPNNAGQPVPMTRWQRLVAEGNAGPQTRPTVPGVNTEKRALSKVARFSGDVLDKGNHAALFLYETLEKGLRTHADAVNELAAKELVSGGTGPKELLRNMDIANRRQVTKLLASDLAPELKADQIRQELNRYSMSRVLFNYDKANQSAFIRGMGPLFATFTRWPVSVASEIASDLRRGEFYNPANKFLFAWGALTLLDEIAHVDEAAEKYPIVRAFLGRNGFSGTAPIGSPVQMFQEGATAFTPPIVETAKELGGAIYKATQGNDEALPKAIDKGIKTFGPGGWIIRLGTETGPNLLNQENLPGPAEMLSK